MSLTSIGRALDAPADTMPTERLLLAHLVRDAFTVARSLRPADLMDRRSHFSDVTGRPSTAWCVRLPAPTGNRSTGGGPA
ncbi:hypothetical protein ACFYRD_36645 [Streptomyces hirsutus]|uniref:hypothetical protein n=1 Tax=Streptomyces hirsutus TaxID=35620 RepID=UPI0036BDFB82